MKSRLHEVKAIIPLFTNIEATETTCTSLRIAINKAVLSGYVYSYVIHTYIHSRRLILPPAWGTTCPCPRKT